MNLPKIFKISRPSVVSFSTEIKLDDTRIKIIPFGTGVCIDSCGLILTAYHVVKKYVEMNEHNFSIVFTENSLSEATAISTSPLKIHYNAHHDFALVEVSNKRIVDGKEEKISFPAIKLPKKIQLLVGEDVATIGFPLRTEAFSTALPDLYKGIISRIDYTDNGSNQVENIMLDINVNAGNSGGPVLRVENGELIGIIRRCHVSSEFVITYDEMGIMKGESEFLQRTNMVDCIPWEQVMRLYDEIKQQNDN
jgi:S1-C subfamily serine protease